MNWRKDIIQKMLDEDLIAIRDNTIKVTDKLMREWFGQQNIPAAEGVILHWIKNEHYICNQATNVSLKKISPDKEHVTCSNCKRLLQLK